jgi:hypothetical protein
VVSHVAWRNSAEATLCYLGLSCSRCGRALFFFFFFSCFFGGSWLVLTLWRAIGRSIDRSMSACGSNARRQVVDIGALRRERLVGDVRADDREHVFAQLESQRTRLRVRARRHERTSEIGERPIFFSFFFSFFSSLWLVSFPTNRRTSSRFSRRNMRLACTVMCWCTASTTAIRLRLFK